MTMGIAAWQIPFAGVWIALHASAMLQRKAIATATAKKVILISCLKGTLEAGNAMVLSIIRVVGMMEVTVAGRKWIVSTATSVSVEIL